MQKKNDEGIHEEISDIFSKLSPQPSDSAVTKECVSLKNEEVNCNGNRNKKTIKKFADEMPPPLPDKPGSPGIFY
jgi:uncharacterized protein (UPF0335 family)